jgi:hypothetical protein
VPNIVSHYLIQSVRLTHAVVVLDLAKPDRPVEVARVAFDSGIFPHWTGYDAKTHRIAVTGYGAVPADLRPGYGSDRRR